MRHVVRGQPIPGIRRQQKSLVAAERNELRQAEQIRRSQARWESDRLLEHLPDPAGALAGLVPLLRPGGTITAIEGDHGSTFFHPEDVEARRAIACQVELQRRVGGDANIRRRLRPLLTGAGFAAMRVSPRMVHADAGRPDLQDGFVRRTFAAMVEGVRGPAVAACLATPEAFGAGIRGLRRAAESDGVFCYTFFKATGRAV